MPLPEPPCEPAAGGTPGVRRWGERPVRYGGESAGMDLLSVQAVEGGGRSGRVLPAGSGGRKTRPIGLT